jgi:GNAT superfamily N-acetyltransferase
MAVSGSQDAGVTIRAPRSADEPAWRRLWQGYLEFYRASIAPDVTAATWRRILDPASPVSGRIAEGGGTVVGFAHCVVHEGTWSTRPIGYLEDLFVDPAQRGRGVGRRLIEDLIATARNRNWAYLYWHTQTGNATARRLYDSLASVDDFVRYRVELR